MKRSRDVTGFYKLQAYDEVSMCWRDLGGRYPTEQAAWDACPSYTRCRVVQVAVRDGRRVDVPLH